MKTQIEPELDSESMARRNKKLFDIDRALARRMGEETIKAIEAGYYQVEPGGQVDWSDAVAASVAGKLSIPPEAELPSPPSPRYEVTRVQAANEGTLAACRRLSLLGLNPLALNFGNGLVPGGGFLHGARAQEESLCRSSSLYATLEGDPMYEANARRDEGESSSWAILSPNVSVYRDEEGKALDAYSLTSFITCAAPVAAEIGIERSAKLMRERISRVYEIAAAYSYDSLVLGAWGCGAFGNDPELIAPLFIDCLRTKYLGYFKYLVFAVVDWSLSRKMLGPFSRALSAYGE